MEINYNEESVKLHKKYNGKLEIKSKTQIKTKKDLAIVYTPGVAQPCLDIAKDKSKFLTMTSAANTVAVISDGSAVLGLGNIGPLAAMPVMEGKAVLFKKFAGIDAFPIVLNTQNVEEIISTIKNIAPSFGGINLEDISSPRCFEIEERLKKCLKIPVFHDDQHGTAITLLAGLINSLKVTKKKKENINIVINGVGAAGVAITKLIHKFGVKNIIWCDSKGIISKNRENLNPIKQKLLKYTNKKNIDGTLVQALENADVFIGVSKGNLLTKVGVSKMNKDPIIFAMANPTPEIMPNLAYEAGARIVGTGRSDFDNQLNNVLVFPGIFKGALKARCQISEDMKIEAALALAKLVKKPHEKKIVPSPFEKGVSDAISKAIIKCSKNK